MANFSTESIPYDVRLQFSELSGGSVDLTMDEESGIAKIVLNHPEKKNALSGNLVFYYSTLLDINKILVWVFFNIVIKKLILLLLSY